MDSFLFENCIYFELPVFVYYTCTLKIKKKHAQTNFILEFQLRFATSSKNRKNHQNLLKKDEKFKDVFSAKNYELTFISENQ